MYERRLPIYLLVDVSASMDGEPIQAVNNGIQQLVADLSEDPGALAMVWLSVIIFSDDASQIVPLTELDLFQIPELTTSGKTNLGAALTLLSECCNRDVRKRDDVVGFRGDYRPMVFVFTDGKNDVGNFDKGVYDFKSHRWGKYAFCLAGTNINQSCLKRINAEAIIKLDNINSGTLRCLIDKSLHWDLYDDAPIRSVPLRKQLLVYIAIDCSETMCGLPIDALQLGIRQLVSDILQFNSSLYELLIGVVAFNDNAVELISPISPDKIFLPTIVAKGRANIGKALKVISDSAENNSGEQTLPPLVFIVSADGRTTGDIEEGVSVFQKRSWGHVVVCAAGNGADVESLRRIEKRNVVQLKDLRPTTLMSFFDWIAQAIQQMHFEASSVGNTGENLS